MLTSRSQGEANYLNERIFKRLSVTSMNDNVEDTPMFLTQSSFGEKEYGSCLRKFKHRLQLDDKNGRGARGDLSFLSNVTMSPWPTDPNFLGKLIESFEKIAEEEIQVCSGRALFLSPLLSTMTSLRADTLDTHDSAASYATLSPSPPTVS